MPAIFQVREVRRNFGRRSVPNDDGFHLRVRQGTRLGLLGRSGTGKTTLLNILGLLLRSSGGNITFRPEAKRPIDYGSLYQRSNRHRISEFRKAHFGYVFQEDNLMENLAAWQNVALPLLVRGTSSVESKARVESILLELFDSDRIRSGLLDSNPSDLSGGERSRIALLRGVIHDPAVLFLDEPLTYLDNYQRGRALAMLERWQVDGLNGSDKPRTIIMITHDLEMAAEFARDLVVISPSTQVLVSKEAETSSAASRRSWLKSVLPDH